MKVKQITGLVLLAAAGLSQSTFAEVSTNIGVVSQYHFRGIQQTQGASTSAGVDYENAGFSVGSWTADVDDGLEVDYYGAYSFAMDNGLSIDIGGTSYQYTGTFDSAYNEINLSAAFGGFKIAYSDGKWDGELGNEAATAANYTITIISYEKNGFTGTYGKYGDQTVGDYFDISYATTIGEFDVGVGLLVSGKDLNDDESLYFSFGKTFKF